MGHIIDKHFYDELFVEKRLVVIKTFIYTYIMRFGHQRKDFEKFLISTETSLKLRYSKKNI